jgi:hypothetical protein
MPRTYRFDHFTALPSGIASDLPRDRLRSAKGLPALSIPRHVETETESLFHAKQMFHELEGLAKRRKSPARRTKTVRKTAAAAKVRKRAAPRKASPKSRGRTRRVKSRR